MIRTRHLRGCAPGNWSSRRTKQCTSSCTIWLKYCQTERGRGIHRFMGLINPQITQISQICDWICCGMLISIRVCIRGCFKVVVVFCGIDLLLRAEVDTTFL